MNTTPSANDVTTPAPQEVQPASAVAAPAHPVLEALTEPSRAAPVTVKKRAVAPSAAAKQGVTKQTVRTNAATAQAATGKTQPAMASHPKVDVAQGVGATTKAAVKKSAAKSASMPAKKAVAKKAPVKPAVAKKAAVKKAVAERTATQSTPPHKATQPSAVVQKGVSKKLVAVAGKTPKPKEKLVRDSFTMPAEDFALIATLKNRALIFKRPAKKSELLRAGLHALQALSAPALRATLDALTPLKVGRPKREPT